MHIGIKLYETNGKEWGEKERQAHRFNQIEWWKHLLKLRYADDAEQTKFHLNGTKVNAKTNAMTL